jgi:hypothetical protein
MNAQSSVDLINPDRRQLLNTAAIGVVVAGMASLFPIHPAAGSPSNAIRPFHVNIPDDELIDLRQRPRPTAEIAAAISAFELSRAMVI